MADDTRYAYAVARVRGMETGLLDRQRIEKLLAETPAGALKALSDTAYQEAVADVGRSQEIESGLERALASTLAEISSICPEPELIDLFRLRWDARNVKSLLKASVLKRVDAEIGLAPGLGTMDVAVLEKAVQEKDYTHVPDFLAEACREAEAAYRDRGELSLIDQIVDESLWGHALGVARAHKNAFLESFFRAEIDLANVRTFVRIKDAGRDRAELARAFLPQGTLDLSFFEGMLGEGMDAFARSLEYGAYGELAGVVREWSRERAFALELACDNTLLKRVDVAKTQAYGIEPLVAFILHRQIEIKLIRTAVIAKLDGLERADVEARLRSIHV
jgi:V/A-type H+-transporting ATPase subunit C